MVAKQRKIVNPKNGRDNVTEATNSHLEWRWGPEKVYHWTVTFGAFSYVMWRFATNEENAFLMNQMKYAFSKSPYGLKQKQDTSNWGWQTTKYIMVNTWKWYLLHPLLGRAMAHVAPSLVPVFYAAYSSLFVALNFGWEVVLLFLGQHAVFYIVAALRVPALCYLAAAVIHCQNTCTSDMASWRTGWRSSLSTGTLCVVSASAWTSFELSVKVHGRTGVAGRHTGRRSPTWSTCPRSTLDLRRITMTT